MSGESGLKSSAVVRKGVCETTPSQRVNSPLSK